MACINCKGRLRCNCARCDRCGVSYQQASSGILHPLYRTLTLTVPPHRSRGALPHPVSHTTVLSEKRREVSVLILMPSRDCTTATFPIICINVMVNVDILAQCSNFGVQRCGLTSFIMIVLHLRFVGLYGPLLGTPIKKTWVFKSIHTVAYRERV